MNFGTKLRTAIALVMLVNQALITIGTIDFGNEISNQIYKWISFIFLVLAYVASHWYNNDFTPIAAEKTGEMRAEKARLKGELDGLDVVIGENDYLEDGDEDE